MRSLKEKQLNLKFESSKYFVYGIGRKIEKAMLTFLLKKKNLKNNIKGFKAASGCVNNVRIQFSNKSTNMNIQASTSISLSTTFRIRFGKGF